MSNELTAKDVHSKDPSYGPWTVSAVSGYRGVDLAEKHRPTVWVSSGSATVIHDLGVPPQQAIEDLLELAALIERGLFDALWEQLPQRSDDGPSIEF